MSKLNWCKTMYGVLVMCAASVVAGRAQTFTTLYTFCSQSGCTDGQDPFGGGLIQATDGNLYGTVERGGVDGLGAGAWGSVFKITPGGTLTTLYSFCSQSACTDGQDPVAGLIQATDGNFYGTTWLGGANGAGTVFRMTPNGKLTTLYAFCSQTNCADGGGPAAGLLQATDGSFYGTTEGGGANAGGTVFKITPSGSLTTLYSFCSQVACSDGIYPEAGLVQASDGNFYGTTFGSGGTFFRITPTGKLTTLVSFGSQAGEGFYPLGGLIQATDGNFYGTTENGGANDSCVLALGCGTVFRVSPGGTLTTLYSFCSQSGCTDGTEPFAGLVQAADGNFYGTTSQGGAYGTGGSNYSGTVFRITPGGTLTTLYSFCSQRGYPCADGSFPSAPLVQDTNGVFYGTTAYGGASACFEGCGTLFSLSVGLGPFVETEPTGGKAGAAIKILGTNLKGATSVTFNGTPATFTVESSSYIRATVPAGATRGTVQVVTPGGTLSSNVPFRVAP